MAILWLNSEHRRFLIGESPPEIHICLASLQKRATVQVMFRNQTIASAPFITVTYCEEWKDLVHLP